MSELEGCLMDRGQPVETSLCPVVIGALCCCHHELPNQYLSSSLPSPQSSVSCTTSFSFNPPPRLLPVLRKGQVVTNYYRWLQRRGGYLWIQSTATVSINHKAPHERNVIWVNYVLRSVQPLQSHTFLFSF